MTLHRISVKYFVNDPSAVDLPSFIPVFHRWIQEQAVESGPIDVADYKHVHEGPGVILVGHAGDYALDMGEGRPGLLYTHKRSLNGGGATTSLRDRLRLVFHTALLGCQLLEAEAGLAGNITFQTEEAYLTFADHLHAPNRPDTFAVLRDDIQVVVDELYAGLDVRLEVADDDPRQPFAVRIQAPGAPGLDMLIGGIE